MINAEIGKANGLRAAIRRLKTGGSRKPSEPPAAPRCGGGGRPCLPSIGANRVPSLSNICQNARTACTSLRQSDSKNQLGGRLTCHPRCPDGHVGGCCRCPPLPPVPPSDGGRAQLGQLTGLVCGNRLGWPRGHQCIVCRECCCSCKVPFAPELASQHCANRPYPGLASQHAAGMFVHLGSPSFGRGLPPNRRFSQPGR